MTVLRMPSQAFLGVAVPATQAALNATGAAFATVVNFVGDMGTGMGAWLAGQVAAGAFRGGGALLVDYHYYLNWDGAMSWAQLAKDVCDSPLEWAQYTAAGLPVVIGEWSGCSNLGDPAYTNISDAGVRAHLSVFFANQVRANAYLHLGECIFALGAVVGPVVVRQ